MFCTEHGGCTHFGLVFLTDVGCEDPPSAVQQLLAPGHLTHIGPLPQQGANADGESFKVTLPFCSCGHLQATCSSLRTFSECGWMGKRVQWHHTAVLWPYLFSVAVSEELEKNDMFFMWHCGERFNRAYEALGQVEISDLRGLKIDPLHRRTHPAAYAYVASTSLNDAGLFASLSACKFGGSELGTHHPKIV
eukprot:6479939-Amphidinium_carterae.1